MGCASSHEPYAFFIRAGDGDAVLEDSGSRPIPPSSPKAHAAKDMNRFRSASARHVSPVLGPQPDSVSELSATLPLGGRRALGRASLQLDRGLRAASQRAVPSGLPEFNLGAARAPAKSGPPPVAAGKGAARYRSVSAVGVGAPSSRGATPSSSGGASAGVKFDPDEFDTRIIVGRGGFAWVRLALHTPSSSFVAIKSVKKASATTRATIGDLVNEKKSVLAFNAAGSPFIVRFLGSYQDALCVNFVFEYVPGGELYTRLRKVGRFPNDVALFYAAELALALEAVHHCGYAYRDLKPENVLLDSEGHLRLIDFGFACPANATFRMYRRVGTANYLAPEMLEKDMRTVGYTRAVDLWAFGCVVFEMLTGTTAFGKAHDPSHGVYLAIIQNKLSIPAYVDMHARALIKALLTPDLSKRMTSWDDVKRHLWFSRVDWPAMAQRRGLPPYVPPVAGPDDVTNFDTYAAEEEDDPKGFVRKGGKKGRPPSAEDPPDFNNADFATL